MDQQSFIYKFLLAPHFSIWRHLTLILFFLIVSVNQTLLGYEVILPAFGNKAYFITAFTVLVYMITIYMLRKVFIKYLLMGKYLHFILFIFFSAILFESIPNLIYIWYMEDYDFFSESAIVDNISSFIVYLLCISGVTVPIFLRNWLVASQHLNEVKKKEKSSKVERLKEQINPVSFFKILNQSGNLVKSEPNKASTMLMKLSQLLRYQLYDCNRDKVLLSSEISFIRNYLELESLYSEKFNYTLNTTENINIIFIPPSILLPYVQATINHSDINKIDIQISADNEYITFTINLSGLRNTILLEKELLKIRERLNTLYSHHYKLTVTHNKSDNSTEVCLKLDKK
ncbi:MAG: histidine kinase [Dysgonomonas sp.]|nr:histidine kinase [Dysgonomonas sp.]